jgi:hypothetical protein
MEKDGMGKDGMINKIINEMGNQDEDGKDNQEEKDLGNLMINSGMRNNEID